MNHWRTRAIIAALTMTLTLALTMAFVLGMALSPAVLLAAPPAQTAEPTIIGFYQSEVIPTGDDSGLQISLTLYEDGSAEAVSDLLTDEPPIVEVGTWEQNDNGSVTLTLTGTKTENYAEPVVLVFELDDDGALSIPGVEGGAFGSEGLTLAPTEPPAPETADEATETPAATAEPAEEQTAQPQEIQVYLSDLLPVATGADRQITLTVNVDGTAEMVTDLMNSEAPVVETGEWARSSGVLTVTLTANADGDYAEPVVYAFQTQEDGSLFLPGEEGGPFGAEGLTLAAPEEADAANRAVDPTGAYASNILPAADAPGMLMLAILYPNGDAQVSSFYLNGEPPIIEFGSWEVGSSETITVTATRSLERDYDEPTSAVFTVTEEGLVAGSVTLHRVRAAGETDAVEAVPAPVAMFQTEVMPAASSPGLQISLTLYDDSSAELVSDYMNDDAPFVDVGTWAEGDDGALILTLTGSADAPSDTPVEIVFDVQDDGTLVAAEYPQEIFGEAGLTLTPLPMEEATGETADGGASAATEAAPGGALAGGLVFQSGTLPAASGGGREITLSLLDDGSAIMSTDFMNDEPPVTELGQWVQNDDGSLTLTLTEGPSGVYGAPVEITFAVNNDGSISAVEYDESVFGTEGLELAPVSSE